MAQGLLNIRLSHESKLETSVDNVKKYLGPTIILDLLLRNVLEQLEIELIITQQTIVNIGHFVDFRTSRPYRYFHIITLFHMITIVVIVL